MKRKEYLQRKRKNKNSFFSPFFAKKKYYKNIDLDSIKKPLKIETIPFLNENLVKKTHYMKKITAFPTNVLHSATF
jgi:hypothetical protein